MNEAETRAEHIDPALKAAGWGVVEGSRVRREVPITPGRIEGLGRRGKGLTADYVLEYRNTKLAVIEAKAWNAALTEGVAQAKNYAGKLAVRFTYATNGQGIYAIDMQTGVEAEGASYPTPDELWKRTFAQGDAWRDRFAAVPYEDILVYERLNREKLQRFAIRDDRTGLGRVYDSRNPQSGCRGEVKFPLGRWKQGEVREYQVDCARGRRPLKVTIEEIDFVHDGVPHSLRFHWLYMEGRGRGTDMRYVYSPLRGLVDVQGNE